MFTDYKIKYAELNLPFLPTNSTAEWPIAPIGNSKISKHDQSILTDEVNDIFAQKQLIVDFILLWTWNSRIDDRPRYTIHSDGHYTDANQRNCALNWSIEGQSLVEWWSYSGGTPDITQKDDPIYKVTSWKWNTSGPIKLAIWNGKRPALLNIKQPHSVRVLAGPRKSVTIRFKGNPTVDAMIELFGNRVIKIN